MTKKSNKKNKVVKMIEEGDDLPIEEITAPPVSTKYIVIRNFIHDADKYSIGDSYSGDNAEEFIKAGFIE